MEDLTKQLWELRKDYSKLELTRKSVEPNPIDQFKIWFSEASDAQVIEPNAMILATVGKDGLPLTRTVLLKEFDRNGFTFYTNFNSRKGKQIEENPQASITFLWLELERQINIRGKVSKVSESESEDYFRSRPHGSRIGAHASMQSHPIGSKAELMKKVVELEKKYPDDNIPRPDYWGGYLIEPVEIEFWQGRPSRLHDRIVYFKQGNEWIIKRLMP